MVAFMKNHGHPYNGSDNSDDLKYSFASTMAAPLGDCPVE